MKPATILCQGKLFFLCEKGSGAYDDPNQKVNTPLEINE